MKTKFITLALLAIAFTISYGKSTVKVEQTSNPTIFNLTYIGDQSANDVVVKVADEQGNVLTHYTVKSHVHFNLPLNFTAQQYGTYYVTVSDGTQSETKEVSYEPKPAIISHTSNLGNGRYVVAVPKGQLDSARVTVFDADNNVLYTSTKDAKEGAAFLLNTSSVVGETTIEVTDGLSEN